MVRYLREHCAWDRRQTAQSLVRHLLEEAQETADAIASGDPGQLRDELGDLLLNLAFQVVVAEEAGRFSAEEVIAGLEAKMIRRHPHLFGRGERESWEAIKARERAEREARGDDGGPKDGGGAREDDGEPKDRGEAHPGTMPTPPPGDGALPPVSDDPLAEALRVQARAAAMGFDWDEVGGAIDKTREELHEVGEALARGASGEIHAEIGDLFFSVVNVARLAGVHPAGALTSATEKFSRRFDGVEALARARGIDMARTPLEVLDGLWEEVKRGS